MRVGSVICLLISMLAAAGPVRAGDAASGERVFRKCGACHTATGPDNRVGPRLQGVVGRPIAHVENYAYSAPMMTFGSDGKVWDEARLATYLRAPRAMVPGTRMTFAGLKSDKDIADVIAYLKSRAAQ